MKVCSEIYNTIAFNLDDITPCCVAGIGFPPLYSEFNEAENIDYSQKQNEMLKIINSEEIKNYKCKDCCYVKENNNSLINSKYKLIVIRHWTACNCDCIYCNIKGMGSGILPKYNPYGIIKKLYENNLIDKENLEVHFQGGDIGVLKEFTQLVELFEEYGYKRIDFCTNNIIYQPIIERIIAKNKGTLSLSLDCGSKNTYLKIKQVDKFNKYIENLKKYINCTEYKNSIIVNYIIVKGINDNKKEISKFLNLMEKIGVSNVGLRLDYNYANSWISKQVPLNDCPDNLDKLILYFFKLAKKKNIKLDMSCFEQNGTILKVFRTNKILRKKMSFTDKIKKFLTGGV